MESKFAHRLAARLADTVGAVGDPLQRMFVLAQHLSGVVGQRELLLTLVGLGARVRLVVTGTVAVAVVWKWIFSKYNGVLNYLLTAMGVIDQNVSWLGESKTALACIFLILFTTSIGQPIVLYIAALGNVDPSLIDAAQVDGATNIQVFWHIKWPQIMPTTLYILVITTINSFQCYALIQLLTSGGPNYSTSTIMYYIYYVAFSSSQYRYGYANAMGVILAIIIAVFSAIQFKFAGEKN